MLISLSGQVIDFHLIYWITICGINTAKDWRQKEHRAVEGWWLGSITDSMDMNFAKLWEIVKDREAGHAGVHGITKSWTWLSDWTTTTVISNTSLPKWRENLKILRISDNPWESDRLLAEDRIIAVASIIIYPIFQLSQLANASCSISVDVGWSHVDSHQIFVQYISSRKELHLASISLIHPNETELLRENRQLLYQDLQCLLLMSHISHFWHFTSQRGIKRLLEFVVLIEVRNRRTKKRKKYITFLGNTKIYALEFSREVQNDN